MSDLYRKMYAERYKQITLPNEASNKLKTLSKNFSYGKQLKRAKTIEAMAWQYNIIKNTDIEYKQKLTSLHRTIAEYRQYYRENYLRKIDSNISNNMNKDYRYQLLNKEINEKKFKQIIHQRYKKHNFDKELAKLILSTFDITELMLWEIVNIKTDQEQKSIEKISLKIYEGIQELINETNTNIIEIKKSFGYTTSSGIKLFDNLRGFPKNFKN